MIRRPPRSTRTDTLFPYTTLFRSTDFDIVRDLIDDNQIPADVTPMVITQLREDLIEETVRSVAGARRVIVHFYNAIAPAWREIVFQMSVPQIIEMVEQDRKSTRLNSSH